jgi:hypothetical protein
MSIDDGFRKMLAGVKQADEGRDEIMAGLEQAWEGRTDLDAQLADLRGAVTALQGLVVEQGRTIDLLRDKLDGRPR